MRQDDLPTDLLPRFEAQRQAFAGAPFDPWPVRADRLNRLQALLEAHEAEIIAAIDADFAGRPAIETELAEIWPSLEEVKGARRHGRRWMARRRVGVGKWFMPARGELLPQPLGVVGVVVPWNYPLYLAIGPMAAALAAGNRVMVKMSEFTPAFSALFARLCGERFAPEEICVIEGDAQVAQAFSALPFDHLLFTGSTSVGRQVMAAAAPHLTPVTLELGGKSPTVVAPGFDVERAAQRILAGKLLNAGQTCIAPDHVWLPREALESFVESFRRQARAAYPGGLAAPHYCSVVNQRQYQRLTGWLDEAAERGARIEPVFEGAEREDAAHRLAPVLVIGAPLDTWLMREEIFGPLLPLRVYDRLDDVIAAIQAGPRPLALYWFDDDTARTDDALRRTHAGGVCVNDTLLHVAQHTMPFGGVGASGMGHYHGKWGFDTFSKLKPVFRQARLNGMAMFLPPYRDTMRRMLALMKRV